MTGSLRCALAMQVECLEQRQFLAASLQSNVNVLVSGSETVVGKPATFTAVVGTQDAATTLPSGTMTFSDDVDGDGNPDVTLGTASIVDGIAQFSTSALPAGFHWVTASYSGDALFTPADSDAAALHVIYPQVIDILVVYTQSAVNQATSFDVDITSWIYAAIAEVNDAFINSQIPASAELVYAAKTDYVETGNMSTDLQRLADPGDGYMDAVPALRSKYGADVMCLWQEAQLDGDLGGLAYMMQSLTDPMNPSLACMTVRQDNSTAPVYAFAHEIGHILGAAHDHETAAGGAGGSGGLYGDSYGYRFTVNGEPYHDLMAYDDPNITGTQTTIPYYSNPDVLYDGVPTGVAGYANAARAIRAAAPVVSKYRPTKVPASTPTTLRLSASTSMVEVSQAVTLTATIAKKNASQQTPQGTVTFYDGATILDTVDVISSKAMWTGTLAATGGHSLRAVYVADDFFGGSVSAVKKVSAYQVNLSGDGTLNVVGSDRADSISVALIRGRISVKMAGWSDAFDAASVHGILISAGEGNDLIRIGAGVGAATIYGGAGNDTLYGGAADDELYGEEGDDRLYGGGGNDTLDGGAGRNRLAGGDGDDMLVAFNGLADVLQGDKGVDTAWFDSMLDIRKDVIETLHPDEAHVM